MKNISLKNKVSLFACLGVLLFPLGGAAATKSKKLPESPKTAKLTEYDQGFYGFSFRKGKPVQSKGKIGKEIDFIVDFPHGIASNNEKIAKSFTGKGGVFEVSKIKVETIADIPKKKPELTVSLKSINPGNQYVFLCSDGKSYGVIKITEVNESEKSIRFSWRFLSR